MDVNDHQIVSPRLNTHKMITALTSNYLWNNSTLRQKVPVNADRRSSNVFIIRNEGTKELKLRSQHLNSLKIFVLSMHLLETYNVVGVKVSFKMFEFEFSVPLSGVIRSNKASGVPSIRRATSIPPCSTLYYLRLCLKTILSPMQKLEKHRVVVRRWEPQEEARIWKDRIRQKGQLAIPRTWILLAGMWQHWTGTSLNMWDRDPLQIGVPAPI